MTFKVSQESAKIPIFLGKAAVLILGTSPFLSRHGLRSRPVHRCRTRKASGNLAYGGAPTTHELWQVQWESDKKPRDGTGVSRFFLFLSQVYSLFGLQYARRMIPLCPCVETYIMFFSLYSSLRIRSNMSSLFLEHREVAPHSKIQQMPTKSIKPVANIGTTCSAWWFHMF